MRKFVLIAMAVLFGSFLFSASAHALPTLKLFVENEFHFQGFTNLEDDDADGHASAGEEIWAIERITLIDWGTGNWQPILAVEELTSVMEDVFFPSGYTHPSLDDDISYEMTPGGMGHKHHYDADDLSFDTENNQGLGDGTLKTWYDTSPDWNSTLDAGEYDKRAYDYASDRDGTDAGAQSWLDLDIIHYQGHFDQLDIWFADDGGGNPDYTNVVYYDGGAGHMKGLLDLVNNYTGYPDFARDSYSLYADTDGDGAGDTWITGDFYLICDLDPLITQAQVGWEYGSNNPMKGVPTPEPATMLLLGSGLIGLAGFARKKFKK